MYMYREIWVINQGIEVVSSRSKSDYERLRESLPTALKITESYFFHASGSARLSNSWPLCMAVTSFRETCDVGSEEKIYIGSCSWFRRLAMDCKLHLLNDSPIYDAAQCLTSTVRTC